MRFMPRGGTRGPCTRVDSRRPMRQDKRVPKRDLERLATAVFDRRSEFGLTQEEFAAQCDLGVATIQRIEDAKITPRAKTLGQLDDGARWERGSARRTMHGGKPTPIVSPAKPLAEWTRAEAMERADELARDEGEQAGDDYMAKWAQEKKKAQEKRQTNTKVSHDAT